MAEDVSRSLNFSSLQINKDIFANSVDSDETARHEPSHQDLHYLLFCFILFCFVLFCFVFSLLFCFFLFFFFFLYLY